MKIIDCAIIIFKNKLTSTPLEYKKNNPLAPFAKGEFCKIGMLKITFSASSVSIAGIIENQGTMEIPP